MLSKRKCWPIALIVQSLAFGCDSSVLCPHPGVPVHGFGVVAGDDRPIWPIHQSRFGVGESLVFFCSRDRRIPSNQRAIISCQSDGQWNGTVPRCDQVLNVERMALPSPISCQHSTDVKISSADKLEISDIRITLCKELAGDLNVSLSTDDDAIFAHCQNVIKLPLTQTFNCDHLVSKANRTSIQISSEIVAIYSVMILIRSDYQCGYPQDLLHGTWQWVNATRVHYQCADSYSMRGEANSICDPQTKQWNPPPTCERWDGMWQELFLIVTPIQSLVVVIIALLVLIVWKRLCCFKKKAKKEAIDIFFTGLHNNMDFSGSMDEISNQGIDNPAATVSEMDSLPVPSRQSAMPVQMFY